MSGPVLLYDTDGAVRTLILNRPQRRNALDLSLLTALTGALDAAEADSAVRAVVVAGAGGTFCAGADLKEFENAPEELPDRQRRSALLARLFDQPAGMAMPVIAAVDGFAVGGGCALAVGCDMVVASRTARFGYPEIRRGLVPAGVVPALLRRVGRAVAFDLIATGREVGADEALRLGIVQRIVEPPQLMTEAGALAAMLAEQQGGAVKRLVRRLDGAGKAGEQDDRR